MYITSKKFLEMVEAEVRAIRQHARPIEISRLSLDYFNAGDLFNCIYGQLTGDCMSPRAVDLISKCYECVVDVHAGNFPKFPKYSDIEPRIYKEDHPIRLSNALTRILRYQTALEVYITMEDAEVSVIYSYLQGETNELKLHMKGTRSTLSKLK